MLYCGSKAQQIKRVIRFILAIEQKLEENFLHCKIIRSTILYIFFNLKDGLYDFFNQQNAPTKRGFSPAHKLQFAEWKNTLAMIPPEKFARIFLVAIVFISLMVLTYFRGDDCKSGGIRSKFSIYKDC